MGTLRLHSFLPYQLSIAANAVSRMVAAAYQQKFDLSVPEWRLVAVLHERGVCTQQDRRIAPAALAYEAQLVASFSTSEIAALREMLGRIETAARELADAQD